MAEKVIVIGAGIGGLCTALLLAPSGREIVVLERDGPLASADIDDPVKLRDAVQAITLFALRAVGVLDARARGLVVQAVMPVMPARRELGALVG